MATRPLERGEIIFESFNGYWKREFSAPSLRGISLRFRRGGFYGVAGRVGAGKSGLLGAILGELPFYSGGFGAEGSVACVEQEPVIFSDSVRGNVLFGRPFDAAAYRSAVERACLRPDFALLERGDATVVGERGATLSGGQKARVALARALYADADVLLLDDPISAVDSRVARQIHEGCLRRLRDKTVILVTHQIAFLHDCDRVVIMEDGAVKKEGTPQELEKELREMSALSEGEEEDDKLKTNQVNKADS